MIKFLLSVSFPLLFVSILAAADFDTEVLPILTNAGCNAAACHGAAAGRGGFKLSLFGGDPGHDYQALVHELEGRRLNLVDPEQSLVVLKPTGELDHEGGLRLEQDGPYLASILEWIRAGAPREHARKLDALKLQPSQAIVPHISSEVQIRVVASFDDQSVRDVTDLAVYYPADPAAVEADGHGKLTVLRRGQHTVVVRFLSIVKTVQLTAPLADESVDLSAEPRHNWIDDEILRTLETLRLPPSGLASDTALLRRIRLDLTGRLPQPEEVRSYAANDDPNKFSELVSQLLRGDEFTEYWTYKLATLLRIRAQPKESQAAQTFHDWVHAELTASRPLSEMAAQLLTAEGDTHEVGPANFYRVAGDARKQAEYVSEVLMGVRLRCANCHNHPLDQWTQDDYHGLAAIFARVQRGRVIRVSDRGVVTHPRTGAPAQERIPGSRFLAAGDDGRYALATWLTSPDNSYFAKAMVNRTWKWLMGRGLIEPTDDLRATNPATHPELLDRLARHFVDNNYDLRKTIELIANSAAYARSSRTRLENQADDRFYSHALVRPLEPEVLADAIVDVTGVAESYGGQPAGTRAVALFDPQTPSESLDILGRCSRENSCETTGGGSGGGLSTKLHLINGRLINQKIASPDGRLKHAIAAGKSNQQLIDEFYARALGRLPTQDESTYWNDQLAGLNESPRRELLEDFLWSLLSCREFGTNH